MYSHIFAQTVKDLIDSVCLSEDIKSSITNLTKQNSNWMIKFEEEINNEMAEYKETMKQNQENHQKSNA